MNQHGGVGASFQSPASPTGSSVRTRIQRSHTSASGGGTGGGGGGGGGGVSDYPPSSPYNPTHYQGSPLIRNVNVASPQSSHHFSPVKSGSSHVSSSAVSRVPAFNLDSATSTINDSTYTPPSSAHPPLTPKIPSINLTKKAEKESPNDKLRERSATFSADESKKIKMKTPRSDSKKNKMKKLKKSTEDIPPLPSMSPSSPPGTAPNTSRKPEIPMYVSDNWLNRWTSHSGEAKQDWNFAFVTSKTEFYSPVEHKAPMELIHYETTSKDLTPLPVLVVSNGHVLRLFRGPDYSTDQPLIITFNLKEISFTVSKADKEKEKDKFLILSRYHGRVFILQPADNRDPQLNSYLFSNYNYYSW